MISVSHLANMLERCPEGKGELKAIKQHPTKCDFLLNRG